MSHENETSWLSGALCPVDLPPGVESRQLVCDAIEFKAPARLPYSLVNPTRSDFFELASVGWRRRQQLAQSSNRPNYTDEWGVKRKPAAGLFDQALDSPLSNLDRLDDYPYPTITRQQLYQRDLETIRQAYGAGKYVVAEDPVCLFDRVVSLTGYKTALLAPRRDPARFERLLDQLTALSLAAIEAYGRCGLVQGFMTWQDIATEQRMVMDMAVFRRFYRPRLERMIAAAHSWGMHFIRHCCGQVTELIAEMIDMKVDVVQLDQPRLVGYRKLAHAYGGKICFWNTLDTCWTVAHPHSEEELRQELQAMVTALSGFSGGLMLRHYPQPADIGLSDEAQRIVASAIVELAQGS